MPDTAWQVLSSPTLVGLVFLVVMFGAMVQAGLGMGFGQTAAPLLALIDPHLVPAPALMLGFATALWGAIRERDAVVWPEVGIGSAGRFIGVLMAMVILTILPDRKTFMLIFGLLIAVSVALSIAGWRFPFSRFSLVGMGTLSGLTGTITSIGAPPLAMIYANREPGHARPTLAAFFAVGCALSLGGLFVTGWAGPGDLLLALFMLPPMVLGMLVAGRLKGRFDRRYRPLLIGLAGTAAMILIVRGLA